MRLRDIHQKKIIFFAKKYFGEHIKLYLFGSRVDDEKKGGDIDLFLELNTDISIEIEMKFLAALTKNVTERKVDLVVKTPSSQPQPIFDTARNTGVRLC